MILIEIQYKTYDGKLLAMVKAFKTRRYYLEAVNMKFSCLQTTTNSNVLCIQRARALGKFVRLKNSQNTTFGLIISRTKLMKLLIPCHNTFSGVLRKKRPF